MASGRPELYPVKKVIGFDQNMLDGIDHWRRQQMPIPTVSDAIRRLVGRGLVAEGVSTRPPEPVPAAVGTKTARPKKTRQRRS